MGCIPGDIPVSLDFIISDQRISKYLVSFGSQHGFCQAWVNLSTGLTVDGRSWRMAPNTWTMPSRPILKKEGVVKSGIWASLFCPKTWWEFLQLKWFVFWIVDWPRGPGFLFSFVSIDSLHALFRWGNLGKQTEAALITCNLQVILEQLPRSYIVTLRHC